MISVGADGPWILTFVASQLRYTEASQDWDIHLYSRFLFVAAFARNAFAVLIALGKWSWK